MTQHKPVETSYFVAILAAMPRTILCCLCFKNSVRKAISDAFIFRSALNLAWIVACICTSLRFYFRAVRVNYFKST